MPLALIDCNSFYASCEQVFRPDLRGRPVIVLSNNDGCIVAMNREAKRLNIPRGTPLFKLEKLFKANNVEIFSSNYTLYGDISKRIMDIIMDSSDSVEVYSIDEAFAEWSFPDPIDQAYHLRQKIYRWVGMPVSIGIAESKTLAKIANHIGKKNDTGLFQITPENREFILKETPIQDVWGIGRQLALFLRSRSIDTAWKFTQMEDWWVKKHLTIVGLRTKWELQGQQAVVMEESAKENRVILSSKSFGTPISDVENLVEGTKSYVQDAFYKLSRQKLKAKTITLYLTTNRFKQSERQYRNSIAIDLPDYSDYMPDFVKAADMGIRQIFRPGYKYKKTSVTLTDLKLAREITPDLFTISDPRKRKIQDSVNEINMKYGKGTIGCNINSKESPLWKMRREFLSPQYTTSWADLPAVK